MTKITDIKYGETNDVKYKVHSMGWYGKIDIDIFPVTDGVWFVCIDFGDVSTDYSGSGTDPSSDYNNSLYFTDANKHLVGVDIAFDFPKYGMFYGQMNKRVYRGTFYEEDVEDSLYVKNNMNTKKIMLGE